MLAVGWWLLANALEASSVGLSTKFAWSVSLIRASSRARRVPAFVLAWTRQDGWLTRARLALLLIVPPSQSAWRRPTNGITCCGRR